MKKILLIILCTSSLIICKIDNGKENFRFKHLTMSDGLSQTSIYSIIQDYKGFIWIGTADGLNRYDAYNFKVFRNNSKDSTTISGNAIRSIFEDSRKNLWVGTTSGILNKYNREKGTFTRINIFKSFNYNLTNKDDYFNLPIIYSREKANSISYITQYDQNHLLIGSWGKGICLFNIDTYKIKYINTNTEKHQLSSNRITHIEKDEKENIWIATFGDGLNKLVMRKDTVVYQYKNIVDDKYSICDNYLTDLFLDSQNNLWIGSYDNGLCKVEEQEKELKPGNIKFKRYNEKNFGLSSNKVTSITEDDEGCIWIGTFGGGLNKISVFSDEVETILHNPNNKNSVVDNDITKIYKDRSNTIWVGTHLGKGLSILDRNTIKFDSIIKSEKSGKGLNDDIVWSIYGDAKYYLIGTYKGGLNIYDRSKKKYKYYKNNPNDPSSISGNHIRSITKDHFGRYWLGTYANGLNVFDPKTEKFHRIKSDKNNQQMLSGKQIQDLYVDKDSTLWIAVFGGGLNKVDISSENLNNLKFNRFVNDPKDSQSISDNRVYSITEDNSGNLWIGTFGGGLNKFNKRSKKFMNFHVEEYSENSITNDRIMHTHLSDDGTVWIATFGGGLNRLDPTTNKIERIDEHYGLSSDVIYAIIEDKKKNLWMSSDDGIIKFNYITENVTYYNVYDGVIDLEFSGGAFFRCPKSGEIFFGGIKGVNHFYPEEIVENNFIPPIVITDIKVFDEPIKGERSSVSLSIDQNYFSFEYAALDFTNPSENRYAYYLEGYDEEWIYSKSHHRFAYYKNLEPGEYIFHVKGSNNDGKWNNKGATVKLTITAPFYRRTWFQVFILFVLTGILIFFISKRIKQYFDIERFKKKLAADLHDNIGSGLTEISILSSLVETELKEASDSVLDKLSNISNTSRNLIESMSDIVWMISPKNDSLQDLIIRLKDSNSEFLSYMNVSFKTNNLESFEQIKLPLEYKQNLYLIFKEAINNAVKHSKCSRLNLTANIDKNLLEIELLDDGKGIDESHILFGNGIENMKQRAKNIGGELTWNSKVNEGTKIKFAGKINRLKFNLISQN